MVLMTHNPLFLLCICFETVFLIFFPQHVSIIHSQERKSCALRLNVNLAFWVKCEKEKQPKGAFLLLLMVTVQMKKHAGHFSLLNS